MAVNKSKTDLLSQAATTLADNTTQAISPQDVREMAENLAESNFNKTTDNALVGLKAYDSGVIYKVSQGVNYNGSLYFANKDTTPGAFNTADWDLFAEQSNVIISGKKASAGTIAKGKPVYLVGFDNDLHTVEEANASAAGTTPVIGFTAEAFDASSSKSIITFGKLTGIDTSSFSVGNDLYLATSAGGLTTTRPTGGSSIIQRIAKVLKSHASTGEILIYNTARAAGLPNIAQNNVWIGDANGQPQAVNKSTLAPTDAEIETAYNNQVAEVTQSEAEAGTVTTVKRWTPQRVKQAIDALAGSGAATVYTSNGSLSGNRVITSSGNTLIFDSSASYVADPFKFQTYPFGGTGTNPYLKIKAYGEVEIRSSLNDIFRLKDGGGGDKFKVNSTQTSIYGNLLVTTTYFKMQSSTQALKFTNTSTGNLTHEIQTDGGGAPVKTKFNIIGGTSQFIVGSSAIIGNEKISLQGHTLIKGENTLSTSSALQIYDGDSTPAVLWDFRNNGDLLKGDTILKVGNSNVITGSGTHRFIFGTGNDINGTSKIWQFCVGVDNELSGSNHGAFGRLNTTTGLGTQYAFGSKNQLNGSYVFSFGGDNVNSANFTNTFGMATSATAIGAIVIGYGDSTNFNNKLVNNTANSLALGWNTTTPTYLFASTGATVKVPLDMDNNRITNAVVNPSVNEAASSATFTINADEQTDGVLTAMSAATTIAAPTGTPVQSQSLVFRFKDDGTARGITWNAIFRAIGVTLPTTTTASKLLYVGCKYNSTDTKWDVVSVQEEA